ncbi:hypothetical protein [Nostoc sp.]|uniref:hypothetical protein n=1 Tax=Nostoc sp. TaxID=1180 RepID=UPI002FF5B254
MLPFEKRYSIPNTSRLRRFVGWVEGRETQQSHEDVGLRNETQPTLELFFMQNLRSIDSSPILSTLTHLKIHQFT